MSIKIGSVELKNNVFMADSAFERLGFVRNSKESIVLFDVFKFASLVDYLYDVDSKSTPSSITIAIDLLYMSVVRILSCYEDMHNGIDKSLLSSIMTLLCTQLKTNLSYLRVRLKNDMAYHEITSDLSYDGLLDFLTLEVFTTRDKELIGFSDNAVKVIKHINKIEIYMGSSFNLFTRKHTIPFFDVSRLLGQDLGLIDKKFKLCVAEFVNYIAPPSRGVSVMSVFFIELSNYFDRKVGYVISDYEKDKQPV